MSEKKVNSSEILKGFIEKQLDLAQFCQLGYFFSNQDEHKYNLGYYIAQYKRYIDFSTLLRLRSELADKLVHDCDRISSVCKQTTYSYHVYIDNLYVIEMVDSFQDGSPKWIGRIDPKLSEVFKIQEISKSHITVKVVKRDVKNKLLISDHTKLVKVVPSEQDTYIDKTYYKLRDAIVKAIYTLSGRSNKKKKTYKNGK